MRLSAMIASLQSAATELERRTDLLEDLCGTILAMLAIPENQPTFDTMPEDWREWRRFVDDWQKRFRELKRGSG